MATPFKLKSGNASAFKNLGSSPAKQVEGNFNKTGSKASTTPGYSTTKAAKTQNPPKGFGGKGYSNPQKGLHIQDYPKGTEGRHSEMLRKTTKQPSKVSKFIKTLKNTPKQYVKPAKEILKKIKPSRAIPVIGEALMTYDVLKEGVKRVVTKSSKLQLPEAKATKFSGGKTWSEAKKGGKSNIWKNKK